MYSENGDSGGSEITQKLHVVRSAILRPHKSFPDVSVKEKKGLKRSLARERDGVEIRAGGRAHPPT